MACYHLSEHSNLAINTHLHIQIVCDSPQINIQIERKIKYKISHQEKFTKNHIVTDLHNIHKFCISSINTLICFKQSKVDQD